MSEEHACALKSPTRVCVGNQTPGAIQGTRVEGAQNEAHRDGLGNLYTQCATRTRADGGDLAFFTVDSERRGGNLLLQ
jgi:hypothetical protein